MNVVHVAVYHTSFARYRSPVSLYAANLKPGIARAR
jgi:hypothetical protein